MKKKLKINFVIQIITLLLNSKLINKPKKPKKMTSIKTLSTRSICDHNCIFTAELLEIKGNFATILLDKKVIKRKIKTSYDGTKYILPYGSYSMAPSFDI